KGRPYRTQIELAAELIRQLAVPAGAGGVVLGDTAFEAGGIRAACAERRWGWGGPLHPERVLAGPQPRPKVGSFGEGLSGGPLGPGQGPYAAQRRAAPCRVGPKAQARTYHVPTERRAVHNVGDVRLVFSTKEQPQAGEAVAVQKILMTNAVSWTAAAVVTLYD